MHRECKPKFNRQHEKKKKIFRLNYVFRSIRDCVVFRPYFLSYFLFFFFIFPEQPTDALSLNKQNIQNVLFARKISF